MNTPDPHPTPTPRKPAIEMIWWTLWVFEVIGFVVLFGCAVLFQVDGAGVAAVPGVLLGLGLFIYGLKISFSRSGIGHRRVLTGGAVILIAAFVIFGSCTVLLN